jgi:hypothetical protein
MIPRPLAPGLPLPALPLAAGTDRRRTILRLGILGATLVLLGACADADLTAPTTTEPGAALLSATASGPSGSFDRDHTWCAGTDDDSVYCEYLLKEISGIPARGRVLVRLRAHFKAEYSCRSSTREAQGGTYEGYVEEEQTFRRFGEEIHGNATLRLALPRDLCPSGRPQMGAVERRGEEIAAYAVYEIDKQEVVDLLDEWSSDEEKEVTMPPEDDKGPVQPEPTQYLVTADEYAPAAGTDVKIRAQLHPVVLGGGKPYFPKSRPPLRLITHDRIGEDVLRLSYVPA